MKSAAALKETHQSGIEVVRTSKGVQPGTILINALADEYGTAGIKPGPLI